MATEPWNSAESIHAYAHSGLTGNELVTAYAVIRNNDRITPTNQDMALFAMLLDLKTSSSETAAISNNKSDDINVA